MLAHVCSPIHLRLLGQSKFRHWLRHGFLLFVRLYARDLHAVGWGGATPFKSHWNVISAFLQYAKSASSILLCNLLVMWRPIKPQEGVCIKKDWPPVNLMTVKSKWNKSTHPLAWACLPPWRPAPPPPLCSLRMQPLVKTTVPTLRPRSGSSLRETSWREWRTRVSGMVGFLWCLLPIPISKSCNNVICVPGSKPANIVSVKLRYARFKTFWLVALKLTK